MVFDVAMMAVLLILGNVLFQRFEQLMPLSRRVLKAIFILVITAVISHYFGRTGVLVVIGGAILAVVCVHAIWLPYHGVNGWSGEPREKYYALRGWPPSGPVK